MTSRLIQQVKNKQKIQSFQAQFRSLSLQNNDGLNYHQSRKLRPLNRSMVNVIYLQCKKKSKIMN